MNSRGQQASVPQAKLVRLLNLINELRKQSLTINQIMERYDVSKRTAYRYVDIIELCDIPIEQDFKRRYYIAKENG